MFTHKHRGRTTHRKAPAYTRASVKRPHRNDDSGRLVRFRHCKKTRAGRNPGPDSQRSMAARNDYLTGKACILLEISKSVHHENPLPHFVMHPHGACALAFSDVFFMQNRKHWWINGRDSGAIAIRTSVASISLSPAQHSTMHPRATKVPNSSFSALTMSLQYVIQAPRGRVLREPTPCTEVKHPRLLSQSPKRRVTSQSCIRTPMCSASKRLICPSKTHLALRHRVSEWHLCVQCGNDLSLDIFTHLTLYRRYARFDNGDGTATSKK